jgi:predicted CopG family antitoxin
VTKQVALADSTYARLKRSRHPGESFSDAIERLLDRAKDPMTFADRVPRSRVGAKDRLAQIEADRDATRVDA